MFLCGDWLVGLTSEAIILPHYAINIPDIAAINLQGVCGSLVQNVTSHMWSVFLTAY